MSTDYVRNAHFGGGMADRPRPGLRRVPLQTRSQARVERILDAARELLVEAGPEGLRPTEVARRASVPIGSVYQYFGDRHDLLAVLVERYFVQVRSMLADCMAEPANLDEALRALREAGARWYRLHADEPSFGPLLFAILGDPVLQRANLEDSRASTAVLFDALAPWLPDVDPQALQRTLLVVNHLFVPAMQLALVQSTVEEQQALFEAWFGVAEAAILRVVQG